MGSRLAVFFDNFIGEPIRRKNGDLFIYRAVQFLHAWTNGRTSVALRHLAKIFKAPKRLPPSSVLAADATTLAAHQLDELGWSILPYRLPEEDLQALREFCFSTPCYSKNPVSDQYILNPDVMRNDLPRFTWRTRDVVKVPAVQRLLKDSGMHDVAQAYLRCRPTLTLITLWLTTNYDGEFDAHHYHYDNENPKFLKFFIYLTDVDKDTGAHVFMPRSHHPVKPSAFKKSVRYTDEQVWDGYGRENEKVFEAPAGTIIVEDTLGFHKGSTPKRDYRLILQLEYAIFNTPGEELSCPVDRVPVPGLDQHIAPIVDKFFIPA